MRRAAILLVAAAACGGAKSTSGGERGGGGGDGVLAFETVLAVFQHPRCQNCHPAGDVPLQGDDGKLHDQNVLRGPEGKGMVGAECSTCHAAANPPASYGEHTPPGSPNGWRMPPPEMPMVFVGVAAGALCEQIKDPARNGGKDMHALREHLDDPLVLWGWEPGEGRTQIPIAREEFIRAFEAWAAAGAPCPAP